ncbi:hypothetical protein MW887_003124 [Aspergillus wentii]|nr:hypothetical protein MW887_003124 [Aspergillus wentii]
MTESISFQTADGVTLRGWFFSSTAISSELPCLVLSPGFSAVKEMDIATFARHFASNLPLHCLVYDNRGFGESDTKEGQPRQEIIPAEQNSDLSDAITYAQSRDDVDADKIGIWGTSFSGGNVLYVGAVDRRVKSVLSQIPLVDGWATFHRVVRPDFLDALNLLFQQDRLDRAAGQPPGSLSVVDIDPNKPSALPSPDSYKFFSSWEEKSTWQNEVTVKTLEGFRSYIPSSHIQLISPTPLLMTVARDDCVTPTYLALEAYSRALEPKQLQILPGGHFGAYSGSNFERNVQTQTRFLEEHLCS